MKILAGIIGGLIMAILTSLVVSIAGASNPSSGSAGALVFLVVWAIGIAIGLFAPRVGKAWRRLLLISGVVAFMLPLAGVIFTGSYIAVNTSHSGAASAGAAIGGTLVSGALGFVGFFLGVILIIVGFLVGRDKQVIYVQVSAGSRVE
ncbi:hypothetical protein KV580_25510 [Pseudomonas chlororaphis]|nr:hypothetical protein [Pseudomonas chlororaphis]